MTISEGNAVHAELLGNALGSDLGVIEAEHLHDEPRVIKLTVGVHPEHDEPLSL